jgi:hypothetical protein
MRESHGNGSVILPHVGIDNLVLMGCWRGGGVVVTSWGRCWGDGGGTVISADEQIVCYLLHDLWRA